MNRRKVSLQQIANACGVSLSTVDRVVNERAAVSNAKRRSIITMARQLGYAGALPRVTAGRLHVDFVSTFDHPQTDTEFYHRLDAALLRYAGQVEPRIDLYRSVWREGQRKALLKFLRNPGYRRHGLIVMTQDEADLREAVMVSTRAGAPTIMLVSHMAGLKDVFQVGIDHLMAGRTAAYMMNRCVRGAGRVLLLSGSLAYLAHRQRVQGFRDEMDVASPELQLEGPVDIQDDPARSFLAVQAALQASEPLVGLYNTGSASQGIRRALLAVPSQKRPLWIAHEASETHHGMAKEGLIFMVIDQDPEAHAAIALKQLLYLNGESREPPETLQPRFHLISPENWPSA
ncbi:LacI family DNA-binding transcriptional regulator [Frateuria aurantia]